MTDFFKAAIKCDVATAKNSPMYIDQTAVMEEQYRHERLVDATLKTEQLLHELELKQEMERRNDSMYVQGAGASCQSQTSPPLYKAPPHTTMHLPPQERTPGTKAMLTKINERSNLWRQKLADNHSTMKSQEQIENEKQLDRLAFRQREAERELNALVVSRQIAAREAEAEARRRLEGAEKKKRRVHPIDVLQQKVQEELAKDMAEGAKAIDGQLAIETAPIDRIYEDEQLRSIRTFKRNQINHIPSPFTQQ